MDEEELTNVVIDFGSRYAKVGFGNEGTPKEIFRSVVGRYRFSVCGNVGMGTKTIYVGEEVIDKRSFLNVKNIVERGTIHFGKNKIHLEDIEEFIKHTLYNELRIAPEECRLLISEIPNNQQEDRDKLKRLLFDSFSVHSISFITNAVLSLNAINGKQTGIVLESGDGVTYIVPVLNGLVLEHAVNKLNIGGSDLNEYLIKLLNQRGYEFTITKPPRYENQQPIILPTLYCDRVISEIKEKYSYVSLNYEKELKSQFEEQPDNIKMQYQITNQDEYVLLNGIETREINIGNELFKCIEPLFQPSILGIESNGIHELIYDSIMKCDSSIRSSICNNILLSGGNTLSTGFKDRLLNELISLAPSDMNISIIDNNTNNNTLLSWIGGSLYTSNPNFILNSTTIQQYEDNMV